jgi:ABC-type branched-subunit amino acid transport system substrate-binding protein
MNKITKIIIGCVVVAVLVLIGVNLDTKNTNIKIGALMPLTGFGSYWGDPAVKGIELAKKDLESIYGIGSVSISIEDSQSDAVKSLSGAQKLLSIDKVDALYTEFSGISAAVSPVAKDAGKTLVYSSYNQEILNRNALSLKTFVSFEVACKKFAGYLNDSNKKILIISTIPDTAPFCARGLETAIPKSNIKVIDAFAGKDFRTLLLQQSEFNPDYIIPIMYEDGSYALLKQISELKIKVQVFSNKQDLATDKNIAELPFEATNNVIYFEAPISSEFIAKIRAAHPDMSDDDIQGAANAYQSMIALGIGLAECPDKSAECVTNYLANKKDFPFVGYEHMVFENRVLSSDLILGRIQNGERVVIQ